MILLPDLDSRPSATRFPVVICENEKSFGWACNGLEIVPQVVVVGERRTRSSPELSRCCATSRPGQFELAFMLATCDGSTGTVFGSRVGSEIAYESDWPAGWRLAACFLPVGRVDEGPGGVPAARPHGSETAGVPYN